MQEAAAPAADGGAANEPVPPDPLDLAFDLDTGTSSARILLSIKPATGRVRVTVAPRGGPDYDVMVRSGAIDAGSMDCGFELGGQPYAADISWDAAMRLLSLRIGREQKTGAKTTRVVDLYAGDGSTLAAEHPGVAYILERLRDGSGLDVSAELKPR